VDPDWATVYKNDAAYWEKPRPIHYMMGEPFTPPESRSSISAEEAYAEVVAATHILFHQYEAAMDPDTKRRAARTLARAFKTKAIGKRGHLV